MKTYWLNARRFGCALLAAAVLLSAISVAISGAEEAERPEGQPEEQRSSVPEALHAFEEGTSLLVELAVPFTPQAEATPVEESWQREVIADAQAALEEEMAGEDVRFVRAYDTVPYVAVQTTPEAREALEASPLVAGTSADDVLTPSLAQSTQLIGAPQAWSSGYRGAGQTIAVIDTGIDKNHPALKGKVGSEACFTASNCPNGQSTQVGPGAGQSCPKASSCFHGTYVAAIAAGNGTQLQGVAPDANVVSIRVFTVIDQPALALMCYLVAGEFPCSIARTSDVIAGLDHVAKLSGTAVPTAVNMSLGGGNAYKSACDNDEKAFKTSAAVLDAKGIALIAATGNDGDKAGISAPACLSSVVSVGASDKNDVVWASSNSAGYLDLLAPGVNIRSASASGGFVSASGTSAAAPHVAGAWALVSGACPVSKPADVLGILKSTGRPLKDTANGVTTPRIDVASAALTCGYAPIPFEIFYDPPLTNVILPLPRPEPGPLLPEQGWAGLPEPAQLEAMETPDGAAPDPVDAVGP